MGKHFLWDPVEDNIVKEIDDSGTTIADYTTEPYLYGDLISQHRDGQSNFYHYDGHGSTMSLTDSAGNVTDTYAYTSCGEVTVRIGATITPFQYLGQKGYYRSESNQCNVRYRTLGLGIARWLSIDPYFALLLKTPSENVYRYAMSNPNRYSDPSGLRACTLMDGPNVRFQRKCEFVGNFKNGWFGTAWKVDALFGGDCECCEFRQYIRGEQRIRINGGEWIVVSRKGFPNLDEQKDFNPTGFNGITPVEDLHSDTNEPLGRRVGPGANMYFDADGGEDRATGCALRTRDYPGLANLHEQLNDGAAVADGDAAWRYPGIVVSGLRTRTMEIELDLFFRIQIKDTCSTDCPSDYKILSTYEHSVKCNFSFQRAQDTLSKPGDIPGPIKTTVIS